MSTTWNTSPIHIVFYKNTPDEIIEQIVEKHCEGYHASKKRYVYVTCECVSLE